MDNKLPTSDQNFVESLIPQRFPFVMVNSITEYSENHLVSGFERILFFSFVICIVYFCLHFVHSDERRFINLIDIDSSLRFRFIQNDRLIFIISLF
ncbi:MAG: hypothetical protein DI622_00325 [Chryseobacterium sp.]|nr:MAG: hypothetical protein DI622_00325 [Chryseobacterium sp.]